MTKDEQDKAIAAKGRHISLVIAGTMVAWLILSLLIGPAIAYRAAMRCCSISLLWPR